VLLDEKAEDQKVICPFGYKNDRDLGKCVRRCKKNQTWIRVETEDGPPKPGNACPSWAAVQAAVGPTSNGSA